MIWGVGGGALFLLGKLVETPSLAGDEVFPFSGKTPGLDLVPEAPGRCIWLLSRRTF